MFQQLVTIVRRLGPDLAQLQQLYGLLWHSGINHDGIAGGLLQDAEGQGFNLWADKCPKGSCPCLEHCRWCWLEVDDGRSKLEWFRPVRSGRSLELVRDCRRAPRPLTKPDVFAMKLPWAFRASPSAALTILETSLALVLPRKMGRSRTEACAMLAVLPGRPSSDQDRDRSALTDRPLPSPSPWQHC